MKVQICDTYTLSNSPSDRTAEHKNKILEDLKKQGCRITKQRKLIIDIILQNECSCCKEIYGEVIRKDPTVGIATVYRMLNALEEAGAINRRNLYQMPGKEQSADQSECVVVFKNKKRIQLSADMLTNVIKAGLSVVDGLKEREVDSIIFISSKGEVSV